MRRTTRTAAAVTILCLLAASAAARELSAAEAETLRAEVIALTNAFQSGDAGKVIERTHPSLQGLAGGPEVYAAVVHETFEKLQQTGMKFLSIDVGDPTEAYPAGNEEICFVPTATIFQIQERQGSTISFMIAIRPLSGGQWKFVDGSGLKNRPEMLYQLFPKLQRGITPPPISTGMW